MIKQSRLPIVVTGAIGVGAALAFAVPANAGVNVQSESPGVAAVALGAKARLDAEGAVVFAPVKVTCAPGSDAYLTVTVTQAVGDAIASGQRSRTISPCTGKPQKIELAVNPTQRPFRKGVAYGAAELGICTPARCTTVVDEHNIQIVK